MKRKLTLFALIFCLITANLGTAHAIGKYKWWATNQTSSWFKDGTICYEKNSKSKEGLKFNFSYKLGQSKNFVSLGKGVSIAGDTAVDYYGEIPDPLSVDENGDSIDENGDPIELRQACHFSDDSAASVAFISPKTPSVPGSYVLRLSVYKQSGSISWTEDFNILAAYLGAESGTNFFTNPPNIFFTQQTYAYLSASNGVKGYTSKGNPRNACLLIYDIAIKGGRSDVSITASDLISSAQGGFFGANVKYIIGNAAIPTAIKCAPWVATYLW